MCVSHINIYIGRKKKRNWKKDKSERLEFEIFSEV